MEVFDYIVVGGGSAGSVVAGRLSESGRHRVLLLEAGPSDKSLWIQLPIGYGKNFYEPRVNWMFRTEKQAALHGREIYQPRGKVLGGSSSINAMVYSRGQPADFDGWEASGNPGWGWADVLRTYKRLEDHALGAGEAHGKGGPLHVTDVTRDAHPLTPLFIKAGQELGLNFTPDLNGESIEGVGYYQINTRDGLRMSAARAYLWPAAKRPNLRMEVDALVQRVLFEGRTAVGVAYRRGGELVEARAAREVVLSAGAFGSPQLLQVSGIGPSSVLHSAGVPVVHALDGVGRHLQDHLCYDHVYRANRPTLNEDFLPLAGKIRVALKYLLTRRGPLAMSVNQGGGYMRTSPRHNHPNIQLYFSPLSYERAPPGVRALMKPDPFPGFSTSVSPCRPTSRGTVEIRSADPAVAPRIQPNYLSTEEDVAELLAGAWILRELAKMPSLAGFTDEELKPGLACDDDAAMLEDVRARAYSVFHPCGSCRMGPDPTTDVVDAKLRVHGIDRLRVVDASIFPTVTSGNINAPSIMVGERGTEFILAT